MKMHLSLLMLFLAAGAFGPSVNLIDRLKTAPVADIESGMPADKFDAWFTSIKSHPAAPKYEIKECAVPGGASGEIPLCVQVRAPVNWLRTVTLLFRVGSYAGNDPERNVKAAKIELLSCALDPSNPAMKFPSQACKSLSELQAMVKR